MFDYFFNELSVRKYEAKSVAIDRIKQFVKVCGKAKEIGWRTLRLHEDFGDNIYYLELADNYYVNQWVEESPTDEVVLLFKNILTESPLINDEDPEIKNQWGNIEYSLGKQVAKGLGAAHFLDTLAVSLWHEPSDYCQNYVDMLRSELDEQANLQESRVKVIHSSKDEHPETHKEWFESRLKAEAENRKDLWEKRETYFPHLIFCGKTEKNLTEGETLAGISRVFEKLQRLNDYAADWKEGGFSVDGVAAKGVVVSNESDSTMQHPKLKEKRRFRLPDGKKEIFETHIKTGGLRFHFYADEETHQIYVGYIGKHIPTSGDI